MKASEAIAILEALDPKQEVTLTLNVPVKLNKPEPLLPKNAVAYGHGIQPTWLNGPQPFWPSRNDLTCSVH